LIYSGNFSKAWQQFTQDPHVAHASYSITILDSQTGSILFEHAKDVGLLPASTMKTITAAAALHYLGPSYTYETLLQYSGEIDATTGFLDGYIYIVGERERLFLSFLLLFFVNNR
jgi:D-alanyl-D-alanine carboxypeptidase/D-alanyl-D-alanine-endopeptidase (penicillin-binding protein 4)